MPVLIEREEELARIADVLERSAGGEGALLVIEGEAGAGKTALLGAARELAAEREMLVLSARGGEYERDFPYGVARQLFEPLLADSSRRARLLSGSAALAGPMFEPSGASQLASADPHAIGHGLYWLASDLAGERPLALLIDDAQWSDRSSLRALAYIARRLDGLAVAVALTVRVGDPREPAELDQFRQEPGACRIEPPPLSISGVDALIAGRAGRASADRLADACARASAGNPFLLAQLLDALEAEAEDGSEPDSDHLAELAAAGASQALRARLAKLGEEATTVAMAVAVLEPNAEPGLVAALAGLPGETVAASCARMIEARLMADARPLSFVHPLVREAILASVTAPLRASEHARAARLLHERGADADSVAAHLLLCEPEVDEWVVARLREAAAAAIGRGASESAVLYLRRALREPPLEADRLAVSRELGEALLRASDPEGIDVLRAVHSALGDPIARAEIIADVSLAMNLRGRGDEAIALLEASLAELPDPEGTFGTLIRGHLLSLSFWGGGRAPEPELLRFAERLERDGPPARLCLDLVITFGMLGMEPLAIVQKRAEEVIADFATIEADTLAGQPGQAALTALVICDRRDLTEGLFDWLLELGKKRAVLPGIAGHYGNRGFCRYLDGELSEGQADAEIAVEILSEFQMLSALSLWFAGWLRCATARGDHKAVEAKLADTWGEREAVPGIPGAFFLCARGEFRLATGRVAEASHDYLAAAERVRWLPFPSPELLEWRIGLARCESLLGNRDTAEQLAREALAVARGAGGARGIGVATCTLGEALGGAEGVDLLREAVAILSPTNARLQHARALAALGGGLRRANRRQEAREPLKEALDLAHACGARPLEQMARTELAATGARPRRAVFTGVDSLTPSELRVASLAADGLTNREIAQSLTVTPKTVETHLRHVFQKLDVSGRTELATALES